MVVAGEPSGDVLGGRLMAALRERSAKDIRFIGVGGEHMTAEGLDSLFPMDELSVMGAFEVLPLIPRLLRRIGQTAALARRARPDVVVTIDAPAFNFRMARRLRGAGMPLVHYVAPTVWAWRPGRAREIAAFLDHLMVLLPFEPPFFEAEGLACTFVGHPVVESGADSGADSGDGAAFRLRHAMAPDCPLLVVLPGSRRGEVRRLLPVFGEAVSRLGERVPGLRVVVPAVSGVASEIENAVGEWAVPAQVVRGGQEKYDAFAAGDAALAASGTVALELAMARLPAVIAYRMNPLTMMIARRLVRLASVNLVNIIRDETVVPEFLQSRCRPELLAAAVEKILVDPDARAAQIGAYDIVAEVLGAGAETPSRRAAGVILRIMANRTTPSDRN